MLSIYVENSIEHLDLFYRFGVSLVIGFLIGLQREYASQKAEGHEIELFAGTRTFSLLALFGSAAALAADLLDAPVVFATLALLAGALITTAYFAESRRGDIGLTTEIAALVTLLTGALCYWDYLALAAALGVATTVLLTMKVQTQHLARRISKEDLYATLKFAVITIIILPLLPREAIAPAPFDVLVPYKIWLMVVFISGISFLGYILIKIVGPKRGVGLTGLLGGLASSTAVTLTFSQQSRAAERLARPFALAILLAWTVMFVRVIVEVAALNRPLLRIVWIPMAAGAAVSLGYCAYLYLSRNSENPEQTQDFTNPFELGPAVTFGLLYAVILVVASAAQQYLGNTGVYVSSIASGLADVDAITLTMAELSQDGGTLDLRTAARAIVLAAAANTVVKGGIVLSAGATSLKKVILPGLLLTLLTSIGVVFLL